MSKIALVVSEIHCRETSDFPAQYAEKMKELWQFQNGLADGRVAASWGDVFIVQHRRMLLGEDSDSYPVTDVRFRSPAQLPGGLKVVMPNSWLLKIYRGGTVTSDEMDKMYRKIIDRGAESIPRCDGVADCQSYIHGFWCNDIRLGEINGDILLFRAEQSHLVH